MFTRERLTYPFGLGTLNSSLDKYSYDKLFETVLILRIKVSAFNFKDLIASKQMVSIDLPSIKRIHQIALFPTTVQNLCFPFMDS